MKGSTKLYLALVLWLGFYSLYNYWETDLVIAHLQEHSFGYLIFGWLLQCVLLLLFASKKLKQSTKLKIKKMNTLDKFLFFGYPPTTLLLGLYYFFKSLNKLADKHLTD